jgi:hypothetical protein
MMFLVMKFSPPPNISSPFGPNILHSTLFSNTISLCSSLNARDQVSHPYRTSGKIIALHFPIFISLDRDKKKYVSEEDGKKYLPDPNVDFLLLFQRFELEFVFKFFESG